MCYVWHQSIDGQIVIHEDALQLIPELRYFEERYIRFIILYADYRKSPIWAFPDDQRYKISKLKAGFLDSDNPLEEKDVQFAIQEFTSLIYDSRRATRRTLQNNIEEQRNRIQYGIKDLKELKEAMEFIKFFEVEINKIDNTLSAEDYDEDPDIKGDKKLSYVERWMSRRKKYLSMIPSDAH